mmetsp:Transcript_8472/g.18615  ORF Transcript_8472/g.18615 Transcript_8472/m.18615 type:complete len:97 (-) Transcript_8472:156-446(-)
MGVSGVLQKLHPILERVHLSRYRGRRAAVDISGLMRAAVHGLAHMLVDTSTGTAYGRWEERRAAAAGGDKTGEKDPDEEVQQRQKLINLEREYVLE